MTNNLTIKGFITNLGKYNEGEFIGKWIDFPIDNEDLNDVLKEIGCCYEDEEGNRRNLQYEAYFFTDWDCEIDFNFGEYVGVDEVNEIAEKIADWDKDKLIAACEIWNASEVLDNGEDDYCLYDDIQTDYDLGYYWLVESGCYDLSSMGRLADYIDYESFGRDVWFNGDGGFTSHGWIEYRG